MIMIEGLELVQLSTPRQIRMPADMFTRYPIFRDTPFYPSAYGCEDCGTQLRKIIMPANHELVFYIVGSSKRLKVVRVFVCPKCKTCYFSYPNRNLDELDENGNDVFFVTRLGDRDFIKFMQFLSEYGTNQGRKDDNTFFSEQYDTMNSKPTHGNDNQTVKWADIVNEKSGNSLNQNVQDGLVSGRYIKCRIERMVPNMMRMIILASSDALPNNCVFAFDCANMYTAQTYLEKGKAYILEKKEIYYGPFTYNDHIVDLTRPVNANGMNPAAGQGPVPWRSDELMKLFAGPHQCNFEYE